MNCKKYLALIVLSLVTVSCANVHQIDRGHLARKTMQLEPLPHQQASINEMHSIREGAAGGTNQSSGGGCGCN